MRANAPPPDIAATVIKFRHLLANPLPLITRPLPETILQRQFWRYDCLYAEIHWRGNTTAGDNYHHHSVSGWHRRGQWKPSVQDVTLN